MARSSPSACNATSGADSHVARLSSVERNAEDTPDKEHHMKRGHVTGTKKETKRASDWYRAIEEATIRQVEAQWQARQAQSGTTNQQEA